MEHVSLIALANKVQTEADAYLYMEALRWGDTPVCPHCGSTHVSYIRPLNGESRKTRTGSGSQRRVWKCQSCVGRKQFSVLTGTVFHGTKISVKTWLFVIFEMCASKNGVSAREIERKYDLTGKSAWFMLHRIREAMVREPLAGMLGGNGGTVVADETFVGGSVKRMNKKRRTAAETPAKLVPGGPKLGGPAWNKSSVLSLVDTTTGEVRSQVIRDVTGATLRKAIAEQVNMAETVLHTDEAKAYNAVGAEFLAHETVNHKQGEYTRRSARGKVTSNQAENFFGQLKRSIDGTHHKVSSVHLHRYLAEFDFRHTTRTVNDSTRMGMLMGQTGDRRLTYRPLTGRG